MIGEGTIGPKLRDLDIPVVALGASRRRLSVRTYFEIRRQLRRFRPEVIQSWMYHSNLAAYLSRGAVRPRPALAWNIRHSLHDFHHEPWLTRQVIRAGARRSGRVEAIVTNSEVSMAEHEAFGYCGLRHQVIPNGLNLEEFRSGSGDREQLRDLLGLPHTAVVVGSAARFHPIKNHAMLAEAVRRLVDQAVDVHLVLIGRGCENGGDAEILRPGLDHRLHLLGERQPLAPLLSGLDLAVVSSRSEGFPNVLAEAMACETPCVTTDVGDASVIVGNPARVVQPGDTDGLTKAMHQVLAQSFEARLAEGVTSRARIAEFYGIDAVVGRYEQLWSDLAAGLGGGS